jgi:hypothetical protein
MKRKLFFTITLLTFFGSSFAQQVAVKKGYKEYFTEGNFLILEKNFVLALKNFQDAYKIDSTSANINYLVGFCYLKTETQKSKALYYLEKAVKDVKRNYKDLEPMEKSAPVNAYYSYGQALHLNYRFDEAIANYEKFRSYLKETQKDLLKDTDRQIEIAKNAKLWVSAPVNVVLKNLGDSINSPYPDYSPVLSADENTLIFTSRRPGGTTDEKDDDGLFFEEIYISYKKKDDSWTTPVGISTNINTPEHEANVSLIADGQTLIIYKGTNGGDLYSCTLEENGWSYPIPMGSDINSKYWETSACLSPDGNTLFFVSDRPGGLGGRDIWKCQKLPNGNWGKAINLGASINTEYDEESPFIHPSGNLLFFSSKGHSTIGGFDIFFSQKDETEKWDEPKNLGYPINTTDDDVFYTSSVDGKRGYYASSSRPDGRGEKDIYEMYIPELKEQALLLVKGLIIPFLGEKLPSNMEVVVTNRDGELVGVNKVSKRNGSFIAILPANNNYTLSYQIDGTEFFNERLEVPADPGYREIARELRLKSGGKGVMLEELPTDDNKMDLSFISVEGKLFDLKGKPIAQKKVNLIDSKGNIIKSTKTNDQGFYYFAPLSQNEDYLIAMDESDIYIGDKSFAEFKNNKGKLLKTQHLGKKFLMTSTKTSVSFKGADKKPSETTGVLAKENKNTKTNKDKNTNLKIDSPEQLAKVDDKKFEMYFKYNVFETDVNDAPFKEFIENIYKLYSANGQIKLSIYASASNVPTTKFKSNTDLAKNRADNAKSQLIKALKDKGVDESKIVFEKVNGRVGGPKYKGDYIENKAEYEKYQFVKVSGK